MKAPESTAETSETEAEISQSANGGATDELDFESLLEYLKVSRGFDVTGYKRSTLIRRFDKRMQSLGISSYGVYRDHLEADPPEVNELFNTILINVTSFFRDKPSWDYIAQTVIPAIVAKKKSYEPIRAWSAGCASGEEAYTLAILFAEALGPEETVKRVKIYATDLDADALATGRQAVYSARAAGEIPEEFLKKYFKRRGEQYVFNKDLRRVVIFGKHDLVRDIPISQIDLLACRNALMYFNSETQKTILKRLHFALATDGYMFLGKAEMLLLRSNDFDAFDVRNRVFTKVRPNNTRDRFLLLAQAQSLNAGNESVPEDHLRLAEASFDQNPLAQILVDSEGTLLLANQTARKLFDISMNQVGRPFKDIEMSYRPVDLHAVARQVNATGQAVIEKDIKLHLSQSESLNLDLHVASISDPHAGLIGIRYSFSDTTRTRNLEDELEKRKQELETAYEELQSSNEELTTTNEELQSTIEELETTNEELQATNEELETMNEELQSTNEELGAINREVEVKSTEVVRLNNFLQSILNSLTAAVIVISSDLRILLWNTKSEEMWGLRSEEVIGQHFFSLDIGLPLELIRQPLKLCMGDKVGQPENILDATNRRGKNVRVRVLCIPFKGNDDDQGAMISINEMGDDTAVG